MLQPAIPRVLGCCWRARGTVLTSAKCLIFPWQALGTAQGCCRWRTTANKQQGTRFLFWGTMEMKPRGFEPGQAMPAALWAKGSSHVFTTACRASAHKCSGCLLAACNEINQSWLLLSPLFLIFLVFSVRKWPHSTLQKLQLPEICVPLHRYTLDLFLEVHIR